jgi:hypothetical protein
MTIWEKKLKKEFAWILRIVQDFIYGEGHQEEPPIL